MRRIAIVYMALALAQGAALSQERPPAPADIDVQRYEISAEIVPETATLKGETKVVFRVPEDVLSIPFDLNNRMSIIQIVDQDGKDYSTSFDGVDSARVSVRGEAPFQAGSEVSLTFRYEGQLEQPEYAFLDAVKTEKAYIDQNGALLLTEGRWFPSHRLSVDAATATVKISVPLGFTVVAPGVLEPTTISGVSEVFTWKSEQPLNRIPVVVARYYRQPIEGGATPMTFFVREEQKQDLKPLTDEVKQIVEFFKGEYGSIPFQQLNLVAVGNVALPSAGSAGLVLLEDSLLNAKMVPTMRLAQRIAVQWWGYSVRPKAIYDAWLQDGFATYAALRYFEAKYPDRYQAEVAKQAINALKYEPRAPIDKGFDLIEGSPEYDSIVRSKGAWVLYMLSQMVGKDKLNPMLADWYKENQEKPATTVDFIRFVKERSGEDYGWFFVQWVEATGVPNLRIDYTILKKKDGTFGVRGQVKQDQELFKMPLDLLIETKGQQEKKSLTLNGKSTSFNISSQTLPIRVKLDPDAKILRDSPQMQIQVQIALGEEYQARGDYVEATRAYEKAHELDPRSSLAAYRLGEVMFLQHSYTNAANSFRDSLNGDLKPDWVETWAHIYMGKIYDILNQRERATAEYQKAINSKNDYNGAQAEAEKYLKEPFAKPQSVIG
jgi:tetratricopeptide (TPR) repeat protein